MAETLLNQQESQVNTTPEIRRQSGQIKKILGVIFSLIMVALMIYALVLQNQNATILIQSADLALNSSDRASSNYRTYVSKYKETKLELEETTRKLEAVNHQLDQVTAELTTTKGMLAQTQELLDLAQQQNVKLKQELLGLDTLRNDEKVQNIEELETKIKFLKERDAQVSGQLNELKGQLRAFDVQFSSFEEGKSLIALFQNKIRLVKSRLNYLSQEAFLAKIAAQKEKDRLATLNGNNGFLLRQGKLQNPNGNNKSFAIDVKIVQ